jgi:Fic family protein
MKRGEFKDGAPGQLVDVEDGCAFVPDSLPPTIQSDWRLIEKLDDATHALAKLDGQAVDLKNRWLAMRPLLTREAVESARLEGTHTHVAGVLLQEAGEGPDNPEEATSNREVLNYLDAAADGERWIADGRPFNEFLVRSLYTKLLVGTRGENKTPGQFRSRQVVIGSPGATPDTATFVPPPPTHVPAGVEDLVRFANNSKPYPRLIAAGIAHYQFETIHPFEDGNGRLGRLLIPLQLMATGALAHPLLYLSPFFESHRDDYLRLLKLVSTDAAWDQWLSFFLEGVRFQAQDAGVRVSLIQEIEREYVARATAEVRSKNAAFVVRYIMEEVVVTTPEVAKHAGVAYNTAKTALQVLERIGIVRRVRDTHPQMWFADDLVKRVYER